MYTIIFLLALICVGFMVPYASKQKDSMAEEMIERIVEKELKLPDHSIDFSPEDKK